MEETGLHGPALDAERRSLVAGIAALEGRTADAVAGYREALRRFRELRSDFDHALCALEFALFVPHESEAHEAGEEARRIFERLGARPMLERLATAGSGTAVPKSRRRATGEPPPEAAPAGARAAPRADEGQA
jgi:hypothetical protein